MDVRNLISYRDNHKGNDYDFREEIVAFQTDDPIDRHFIYQAVGIAQEDKGSEKAEENLAYMEAKTLYEEQTMIDDSPGAEADNCRFLQEVFFLLYTVNPGRRRECVAISCDTMNSISTTMNELLSFHKSELEISRQVSKRKSVKAYRCHEGTLRTIIEGAEGTDFLRIAYTIGNFTPISTGCNSPRGFNNKNIEDYWDLTLNYIYKWYQEHNDEYIKNIVGPYKTAIYRDWLESFGNWDTFVQKNFMQPFVDGGGVRYSYESETVPDWEGHFGPPKALWEGHLEEGATVLPQNEQQISDFFKNAAAAIYERSKIMIEALKQKI